MTRLDDTGMNRANGNLVNTLALGHAHIHTAAAMHISIFSHCLTQRIKALREGVMQDKRARVGMILRHKAKHILNLALIPNGSRNHTGQGFIAQGLPFTEDSLNCLHFMLAQIFKNSVNRIPLYFGIFRFIPAKHSGQRIFAAVGQDIGRAAEVFRFYDFQ